ncbi:MAG: 4-alpha-glucanotransferase [Alphaproteobacteria bacterium]|nr:4-alpha-glucanotransferase [Alphaproteobacteria bacterium]
MTAGTDLDRLAALAGIEEGWWDFFGEYRPVSADTKRAFLEAMGFAVADDGAVARSLREFEERPWRRPLEPVALWRESRGNPEIAISLPAHREGQPIAWTLEEEIGATHGGGLIPAELPVLSERDLDGEPVRRRLFRLPGPLSPGIHRFLLPELAASTSLIVVPDQAWCPPELERGRKLWGVATQTYALRGERDWGIGDFGALAELCRLAGEAGASAVGINPLHALFPSLPERFSPYSPSSRLFVTITGIDVEAIPDFAECAAARRMVAGKAFRAKLARLRADSRVDYPAVMALKMPVLALLHAHFRAHGDGRAAAFHRFQAQGGRAAEMFATFQALQEHFLAADPPASYWRHWPEEFRHPDSPAVIDWAGAHRERVEFFWWLQWQAEQQLGMVAETCRAAGMPIGLYRDLGVGIADDGAEAWARQDLLSLGVSVGAPPDPLNLLGQDWGLAPFNPVALREAAYRPFLDVLAANMRHAGALRLDHAMLLQRLYWVPRGAKADQGAYVRYPVDDLFGLVALMSRRQRCLVIGEDLGTVPDGFRERMFDRGLLAYRLLVFERDRDGEFLPPDQLTEQAVVQVGTHDLPSLRAWWMGTDLDLRERLSLFPRPEMVAAERAGRARDRERLVAALARIGLLPANFPTQPELSDDEAGRLAMAVHDYVGGSASRLMLVQIEDVLALALQMNLPGTCDEHPNWRSRLPVPVAQAMADGRMRELARRLAVGRGRGG